MDTVPSASRFLPSGDEAGSAPGDRPFRPDVEGLRAVAILLVVAFHVSTTSVPGGYVGVDVFFVISGFVITGLLLRDYEVAGGLQFVEFYARRARRILPMAVVVIVASLVAMHLLMEPSTWTLLDGDARWSALFVGNFRFASAFPSLLSHRIQSPFEQLWSLAVEEQFYIIYPALFAGTLIALRRVSRQAALTIVLMIVVIVSLTVSISSSHVPMLGAYYLPFARAWELATGALIAIGTGIWRTIPGHVAAAISWIGLGIIMFSGFEISLRFAYPGAIALVPVLGAALVIVGGTNGSAWGAESILGAGPSRSVGRVSYSWYLWHWPILAIVAAHYHSSVAASPVSRNLLLVLCALALSYVTYAGIERPVRKLTWLVERPAYALLGAAVLIGSCVLLTYVW